ncbi:MAG: TonB-dependent siderophore receptor [Candidatus Competibacteraceae bacterium]|nr:MAG: TonB-dependent siderophore receptor [Candidatus Competibacteraceae bacterium]
MYRFTVSTQKLQASARSANHRVFYRLAFGVCCGSFCLFSATTVVAFDYETPTASLPEVVVTDSRIPKLGLDRPTATGSRVPVPAHQLPASVESVDSATIRERGDYEIKDAITRTTGLTAIGSGGNGGMAFSVRGFTGTNSVGLSEDGVRLSTGAGTQNYPRDSWGYERIEVLRGPASITQGSGTVGATINAVRKTPSRESSVDTLFGIGTEGTARLGVGATGALGDIASFRLDAYGHRTDGARDLGDAKGGKFMSTLRLEPSSDLSFEVLADYSDQRPERYWGTPLADGRINESLRHENYNASDAIIRYEDTRFRGRADWRINEWLTLRDEVHFFKADRHWKNIERYRLNVETQTVDRSSNLEILHDLDQVGNRLEGMVTIGDHQAVIGWEVTQVDFQHTNNAPYGGESTVAARSPDRGAWFSPDPTLPKYKTDSTLHAIYAEDAWQFSQNWLLLAGIRRDFADVSRRELVAGTDFDTSLAGTAWRLGLTYQLNPDTNLYAQFSTGHDPVTSIITMNLGNKDFSLTKARQVEAGIKQRLWGGRGEWTAAVYRIEKDDIITRDPVNPALSVQGGSQHSQGIELAAAIAPTAHWRFEGNLALLRAEYDELIEAGGADRSGNRPLNVPEQVANLWGHYQHGAWQFSLGGRYVGRRYGNNANTLSLPSYVVADASLAWQYDSRTTLRLLGRNLTDEVYATTSYGPTQFMLGESRSFELIAEMQF